MPGDPNEAVMTLADVERRHILGVLTRAEGNKSHAAKLLGIGRNTLMRRLRDFGVDDTEE